MSLDNLIVNKVEIFSGETWKNSKEAVEVIHVGKIKLDNPLGVEIPGEIDGVVFKSGGKQYTVSTEFLFIILRE
jgi:hypothetical protein